MLNGIRDFVQKRELRKMGGGAHRTFLMFGLFVAGFFFYVIKELIMSLDHFGVD